MVRGTESQPDTRARVRALVESDWFSNSVITVILFNAFLIGLDTYIDSVAVHVLEWVCVAIFVVEIALKFYARESTAKFFGDGWNVFDVIIVSSAFIPAVSGMSTALRVLRVFRVLRLITGISELRLIVDVLARSVRSMTYIALLMLICFYVYAIIGVELFGAVQPEYATLHESFFSLFRSLTAEDWTDLRYDGIAEKNYWVVTIFHVSWMVISSFLLVNLVVGAVVNNYQEVQEIEQHRQSTMNDVDKRIVELMDELSILMKRRDAFTDQT